MAKQTSMASAEAFFTKPEERGDRGPDQLIIKAKVLLQATPSLLLPLMTQKSNEMASTCSPIPPGQKPMGLEDYERDNVGKYAQYF